MLAMTCSEEWCRLAASDFPGRVRSMRLPWWACWKSTEWGRGSASSAALRSTVSARGLSDSCQVW